MKKVIVELVENVGCTLEAATNSNVAKLDGFTMDGSYEPVPIDVVEDLELASAIYSGVEHAS